MIEILPAKRYYGAHATGTVVLNNGQPRHFTGDGNRKEANEYAAKLLVKEQAAAKRRS